MRRTVIISLALFFFSCEAQQGEMAMKYDESLKMWRSASVDSYTLTVSYRAFSPHQGEWKLTVKNGRVVKAWFNGAEGDDFIKQAERFTVDSIYEIALAVKYNREDSPMVVLAEFSNKVPYIRSVKRIRNEKFKGNSPKDTGFSITVIDFRR